VTEANGINEESKMVLQRFGSEILHIATDLQTMNLVHHLPSTSLSPMQANMLILLADTQHSSSMASSSVVQKLDLCSSVVRELCVNYPVVKPILDFFEYEIEDMPISLSSTLDSHHLNHSNTIIREVPTDCFEILPSTSNWSHYLEIQGIHQVSTNVEFTSPG
jgi:hypothetical protein